MARLIEVDNLTRWLQMLLSNENPLDRKARAIYSAVLARVNEMPIIDAVPVVLARWEYLQYDANPKIGNWHCSKCRKIMPSHMVAFAKYCPGCGAKMDGGS